MTAVLSGLTVIALGLWFLWERTVPAFVREGGWPRLLRNAGMGMLGLLATFAVVTPVSLAAAGLGPAWRADWPFPVRLATDLLVLELYIYWWHRAMHEVPVLWRFHRVHHYDAFLDVTSAIRFHPGEVIISAFVRGTLIALLDIGVTAILIFDALVIIAAGFHHSNVRISEGADRFIRRLLVTPRHHRIHHIPERQYTDSNYGTVFSFWDRLFGTWKDPEVHGRYGVEGAGEKSLGRLIVDPFAGGSKPD